MKCVLIVLVAGLALVHSQDVDLVTSGTSLTDIMRRFQKQSAIDSMAEKMEQVCPGTKSEGRGVISKLMSCMEGMDVVSNTKCAALKNDVPKCFKRFVAFYEECVPENTKGVPQFVVDAVVSVVDYVCHIDGEHIFEMSNTCIRQPDYKLARCQRKVVTAFETFQKKTPGKETVCEMMNQLIPCFESHLKMSCEQQITREAALGILKAVVKPCGNLISSNTVSKENELEGFLEVM